MKNEEHKKEFANIDEIIKFIPPPDFEKHILNDLIPNASKEDREGAIIIMPNAFEKDNGEVLL